MKGPIHKNSTQTASKTNMIDVPQIYSITNTCK